jgi:hypothetical protein
MHRLRDLGSISACVVALAGTSASVAMETSRAPVSTAQTAAPMSGGGELAVRRAGEMLQVVVTGPRPGLASLCVGDESRVRILHASAAVGEATYVRSNGGWTLTSGFDFKLRDSRTGPPSESSRREFLTNMGWIANASNAGDPRREFSIQLSSALTFLGAAFYATSEPARVSHWPPQMDDDCRAVKVVQGFLPAQASFRPATWHPIK